jgi:hypothetical protein
MGDQCALMQIANDEFSFCSGVLPCALIVFIHHKLIRFSESHAIDLHISIQDFDQRSSFLDLVLVPAIPKDVNFLYGYFEIAKSKCSTLSSIRRQNRHEVHPFIGIFVKPFLKPKQIEI